MLSINYKAIGFLAAFLVLTVTFSADPGITQSKNGTTVREMKEVRVTAEAMDVRLSGGLARYGSQVDIVTDEDMEKAGVSTINEALDKLVPGVHVPSKMGPFSGARVKIQGASKRNVVWMVDGIRLSNRAFTTFRNNIAPQFIQRIEVIKGPQSIIYGSQGIAGIINIITKDIQPSGEGTVEVSAGAGDRDYQLNSQHGDVSGRVGNHSFIVFGNSNSGQNRPFKNDEFETTASPSAREREFSVQNIGAKYRYDMGANEDLLLYSQLNRADLDWVRSHNLTDAGNERIQSLSYAKWSKKVGDQTELFVKAYYHLWDTDWTFIGQDNSGQAQAFSVDEQWYFNEMGLTPMVDYTQENGSQWIGGVDFKQYSGKSEIGRGFPEFTEQLIAPFALYRPRIPFDPKTKLNLGGRYSLLDKGENNFAWNASVRRPVPKLAEFLPFTHSLDVRALFGEGFALPKVQELQTAFEPGFKTSIGNPDLEPIESTSFELGIEGRGEVSGSHLTYAVNYFNRENDQTIVPVDLSPDTRTFVNSKGTAEVDGFEAKFGLRPHEGWFVQMSATYIDGSDSRSRNTGSEDQISNVPETQFKTIVRYDDPKGNWGTQFTGNYVGEIRDVGDRLDSGLSPGLDPNFGEYFVADIRGYIAFGDDQNQKISLSIQNLLNDEFVAQLDEGTTVSGNPFRSERLGQPLTATLKYTQRF